MADKKISDFTAVTALASGDLIEIETAAGNSRKVTADNFAATLPLLAFRGALAKKNADQTTANYSAGVTVAWDGEDYDTAALHDTVTNNTRMTVPSGASYIRMAGCVSLAAITTADWANVQILKNGAVFRGGGGTFVEQNGTAYRCSLCSPVLAVTAGDYFELHLQVQSDTSITVEAATSYFAMEVVA